MKKYLLIPAAALFILAAAPALGANDSWSPADFSQYAPANAYQVSSHHSPPYFLVVGAALFVILVVIVASASSSSNDAHRLPKELQPRHSAEHYDQEAARVRAFTRQLQAEAELAESKLRASGLDKPSTDPKPRGRK